MVGKRYEMFVKSVGFAVYVIYSCMRRVNFEFKFDCL
jgi:hypothetical protein